jgi:hypothetical protein
LDITKWNWDDALAVWYQEGWMAGLQISLMKRREKALKGNYKETIKKILEDVAQAAIAKGFYTEIINTITRFDWFEANMERVRNYLAEGLSPEEICTITGLDIETVMSLEAR